MEKCQECKGLGEYTVCNAYDPKYKEIVICDYCEGSGIHSSTVVKKLVNNWLN